MVLEDFSVLPAIVMPTVPIIPVRFPRTEAICSTRYVEVVLPFVPVIPTRLKSLEGQS